MENLLSTKFLMSTVCLIMVFIAFMAGKIGAQEFMPFVLGILATYSITNTVSKFSNTNSAN